MSRIMISGTGSNCGKTTVTCGLLLALKRKGIPLKAFKAGPDYIDPMFHEKALGVSSGNLDLFLMGLGSVQNSLKKAEEAGRVAVIEGAMGYYDGLGDTAELSANECALLTKTPTILVVSCEGQALSLAAQIKGFLTLNEHTIAGIFLIHCKAPMFDFYKKIVAKVTNLPVVGFLPKLNEVELPSRHLGLVTAPEIKDLQNKLDTLADTIGQTVDLDLILGIASKAEINPGSATGLNLTEPKEGVGKNRGKSPLILVSRDEAFCFEYEENLMILENLGAKIQFFSPLHDTSLPKAQGMILWGGYPELYANALSQNETMRQAVLEFAQSGKPIYAECGGYMYLCQTMQVLDQDYPMVGFLPGQVRMTTSLQNFGYATITGRRASNYLKEGEVLHCHNFHHSICSKEAQSDFVCRKKSTGKSYPALCEKNHVLAGYPHLHFAGAPQLIQRFYDLCQKQGE